MDRLLAGLVLTFLTVACAVAASPNPKDLAVSAEDTARARELVRQLGSEVYSERERAQIELGKMGRLAMPALAHSVAADPDPEIRMRCNLLLPLAMRAELKARQETFLADVEGKFEHDLPGWNEYRKIVGSEKAARDFFGLMLADEANRKLIFALDAPPTTLVHLSSIRLNEILQSRVANPRGQPTEAKLEDIATVLLAESSLPSEQHLFRRPPMSILFTPQVVTQAAASNPKAAPFRALVAQWANTRDEPAQAMQALTIVPQMKLTEASPLLARMLTGKGPGAGPPSQRAHAALVLADLGDRATLPALEKAFADEAVVANIRRAGVAGNVTVEQIEMRDVALASALVLTGQKPADYGFTERMPGRVNVRINYMTYHLPVETRSAAFDKWKAWREANTDAPPKK